MAFDPSVTKFTKVTCDELTVGTTLTLPSGAQSAAGDYTIGGNQIFTGASKGIIPGATSFLIRNNANNASNVSITDAGVMTIRGGLIVTAGGILSPAPTAGIGYSTGAGGAVTQITSRVTGVTLSKISGTIQTDTSSLAAEAVAEFIVTNTTVAIGDVVVVAIQSGANGGSTKVYVSTVAAGSFKIKVANDNAAGGTAETGAIIINFAVIKAVAA